MAFLPQPPRPFSETGIGGINPGQSGCYGIFNGNGRCIYIGKAQDIRRRLLEHVRGQSDQSRCIWSYGPTYFLGVVVSNPDAEEQRLISEYEPICNLT